MNRDEALDRDNGWMFESEWMVAFSEEKLISHINKIYDGFESEKEASIKIIEKMERENKKAREQIKYWKRSFNKQVEASRR